MEIAVGLMCALATKDIRYVAAVTQYVIRSVKAPAIMVPVLRLGSVNVRKAIIISRIFLHYRAYRLVSLSVSTGYVLNRANASVIKALFSKKTVP